jgi:hypothetical protein
MTKNLLLAIVLATLSFPALGAERASLRAPQYVGPPTPERSVTNRAFQGIPSMAVAPGGRLWANWYAGVTPGEDQNNYVVLSSSGDNGKTWRESLVIDPDGPDTARAFDPELWISPDGRLFVFWAQMDRTIRDTQLGVWCIETSQPDSPRPEWSSPRRIGDGVMMCKPLVLSSGEWGLPISLWREHDNSAQLVVSKDRGRTWTLRGACNVPVKARQFDEHMYIERRDKSLWLLVRTTYGIGESVSTDRGATWPELKPSKILHTPARFFIRRLNSGNLLLVKHGPIETKTGRSHLTAYVSADDGATWGGGLLLDERRGVSYPDGQQTPDGLIRIIYDYSRTGVRNILMASFREEDVVAGKAVSNAVRLRQLVSKASGGRKKATGGKPKPVKANANGEPLRRDKPGTLSGPGVESLAFKPGVELFTDRGYVLAEAPEFLKGARFIKVAMDGAKSLTCERAGTVWLLTSTPERNRDSQTNALEKQGFKMAALPEIRLFNPSSPANHCTLYQKDCAAGETVSFGKWATPLLLP